MPRILSLAAIIAFGALAGSGSLLAQERPVAAQVPAVLSKHHHHHHHHHHHKHHGSQTAPTRI